MDVNNWHPFFLIMKGLDYQYIIIGAGCAGLQMTKALLQFPHEKVTSVLLIESSETPTEKSWCFWYDRTHHYSHLVKKEWKNISFKANNTLINNPLKTQTYQFINSIDFEAYHLNFFKHDPRLTIVNDSVLQIIEHNNHASVLLENRTYTSSTVFNSVPALNLFGEFKPKVWQHFLGWKISTESDTFNPEEATLMDFDVDQNKDGRFMYILPFSKTSALIECTIFSDEILPIENYENSLKQYISRHFCSDYKINSKEKGLIPMSSVQLPAKFGKIIPIGAAGGCIKPSTGYSFIRNLENTQRIVECIKHNMEILPETKPRFRFYDNLLLWIIENDNSHIKTIFNFLFKKNSLTKIFSFLDEKTNLWQELGILFSLPKSVFLKALFYSKIKKQSHKIVSKIPVSSKNNIGSVTLKVKESLELDYLNN
jgi:lycopene beta-cyclase